MPEAPVSLDNLNLDCMDLRDMQATAMYLDILAQYAKAKAEAMACRAGGNITRASVLDVHCDTLYQRIPLNWRW